MKRSWRTHRLLRRWSSASALTPFALALAPRVDLALRVIDGHSLAFSQPAEAAGDDDLAGVQPPLESSLLVILQSHGDRPHRHGLVGLHHIDIGPARAALNGCRRHDHDL